MAASVAGVLLFLAGVRYGQATARRQAAAAEPPDAVAVAAGAPGARYDEEPRPALLELVSGEPSAAASAADDLTYHERLEGAATVDDTVAAPVAPARTDAAFPAPAGRQAPTPSGGGGPPPLGAAFTVQVAALQAPDAAEQVVGRLIAKGFPAYVRPPAPDDAVAMYRVRVGRYPDYEQADRIRLRLEEEHFRPWITR